LPSWLQRSAVNKQHLCASLSYLVIIMTKGLPPLDPKPAGQQFSSPLWTRKPRRITITLPDSIYDQLLRRSDREGRSISNLAAFLLEYAIAQCPDPLGDVGRRDGWRRQVA
jgi:hypothetical protein